MSSSSLVPGAGYQNGPRSGCRPPVWMVSEQEVHSAPNPAAAAGDDAGVLRGNGGLLFGAGALVSADEVPVVELRGAVLASDLVVGAAAPLVDLERFDALILSFLEAASVVGHLRDLQDDLYHGGHVG